MNAGTTGFFVAPIRDISKNIVLVYDTSTNEITYTNINNICACGATGAAAASPSVFALNIVNSTIPPSPASPYTVPVNNLNANTNLLANVDFTRTASDIITYSGTATKTFSVEIYASIYSTNAGYFALQLVKNATTAINQGYITTIATTNYEMSFASVVTLSSGDYISIEGDNGGVIGAPRMTATASAPLFTLSSPTIPFQIVIRELL